MEDRINQTREKIEDFWRKSLKYYGKEIVLGSNQYFSIDQIRNGENLQMGIYDYRIQYGFPQSGCITIDFSFDEDSKSFSINNIIVYAPPADKEFVVANYAPQVTLGEMNVSANFGIDMHTEKHASIEAISQNPNALNMLDFASDDLDKAEVLGECRVVVPSGSEIIPMCNCTNKPYKGKR